MTRPRDDSSEAPLPYGVVRVRGGPPQPALRDDDNVVLVSQLALPPDPELAQAGRARDLNALIELGPTAWHAIQRAAADPPAAARVPLRDCESVLPIRVTDFVDFYASLEHATNFGRIFRPGTPPVRDNWRHMPVAYHGRTSTIVVSGTEIRRPSGQVAPGDLQLTAQLDLECELGYVCGPSARGPIAIDRADEHLFGVVLVNDWSARDVQRLEYEPLGPFLAKSFATSMSAWITPLQALAGARRPRPPQDPPPAPYLSAQEPWVLDAALEIELNGTVISRPRAAALYWTPAQMLAHLTVNGARLSAGDLLATGTISGTEPGTAGSLAEQFGGERWLADGDEVVLRGQAGATALGEVGGRIVAG
ncbi:MAG TPA: fumarylacetoacetate hydrolase family protein [Solirubrobacteraceae bacterium]|nr:fumarylacetoacetate hydrolase family protein [Solirubrobacteraceae bacterium]